MESVQDTLARAGIFQGVDPDAVVNLIGDMQTETFPRGTTIFDEGEPGNTLYIIIDGKVKLARHAPDGRENLLSVMGPSDMFGELSIFDPGPRTSSAVCVTEVTTATMDSEMLKQWIADHPEISQQLLRVLARRLRRTTRRWQTSSSPTSQAAWLKPCFSWPTASVSRKVAPYASTTT